jgi:hypothetical protein
MSPLITKKITKKIKKKKSQTHGLQIIKKNHKKISKKNHKKKTEELTDESEGNVVEAGVVNDLYESSDLSVASLLSCYFPKISH